MTDSIKLSEVLKRELKGKTLTKVAKDVGISPALLHDWHSSSRKPSAKNMVYLKKLADYLSISLEEILFDTKSSQHTIATTTFYDNGKTYRVNIERIE